MCWASPIRQVWWNSNEGLHSRTQLEAQFFFSKCRMCTGWNKTEVHSSPGQPKFRIQSRFNSFLLNLLSSYSCISYISYISYIS
jgi:hypothetical protein